MWLLPSRAMWFKIWARISQVRLSQVKLVFLMKSELVIVWQQVFPEVQIGWKIKGEGDLYFFLLHFFVFVFNLAFSFILQLTINFSEESQYCSQSWNLQPGQAFGTKTTIQSFVPVISKKITAFRVICGLWHKNMTLPGFLFHCMQKINIT